MSRSFSWAVVPANDSSTSMSRNTASLILCALKSDFAKMPSAYPFSCRASMRTGLWMRTLFALTAFQYVE